MGKIKIATQWMIDLANDDEHHGYDQEHRWGPDYDCASAVISAWENAGVPVKSNGATYTGNMKSVFLDCGFSDVTSSVVLSNGSGLQYGDVLLNTSKHTAMFIGNKQIVHASINEKGTTKGGKTGDKYGNEIWIRSYYNYPWDCILRYTTEDDHSGNTDGNQIIRSGQIHANNFARAGIATNGVRDAETKKAGIKVLQTAMNKDYNAGLAVDGIWGNASSSALGNHYVVNGETQYMVTAAEILVMLRGYNPNGVEYPGTFGSGLKKAINSFKSAQGLSANGICNRATFLALIS